MLTAVVTGANSGIAHAFAKILLDEGYKVYAVDRDVGDGLKSLTKAEVSKLDVTSLESIQAFKSKIGDEPIDLLLNIAGIAYPHEKDSLEGVTLEAFQKTFAVNTFGPMFVTQALLPNVLKSKTPKIGIVTSRVGSIGDNSTGGGYAYRSSKAAANAVGKNMAEDLKEKGVLVMLLHPGIVQTNILPDMGGKGHALPDEAATKLWKNIVSQKTLADTGKFWHREGYELPW